MIFGMITAKNEKKGLLERTVDQNTNLIRLKSGSNEGSMNYLMVMAEINCNH